jgi:signal transduction histidine kinase
MGLGIPFLFGGTLVMIHRNLHGNLLESLQLRQEKSDLVEQLKVKNKTAEKASQDKSRFLAAASHDLRQPLHAQILLVNDLKEQLAQHPAIETVQKLETSMNAMNGLFNELLDISKLDANVVKPHISTISVDEIFNELAADFAPLAADKNLKFRMRVCRQPSPASGTVGALVRSDRYLLSRILRNLLSNAIRYTSIGGVLLSCRIRKDKILVQVWDTGAGIPNDQSESIFDEFYQLHNPERDHKNGLGLGLAIVARLAKLLQCKLTVSSQVQKGSVFSIEVPRANELDNPFLPSESTTAYTDFSGIKVLLVEDNDLILSTMRALLLKWGCHVIAANSFQTAMNHIGSLVNGIDLIIADYRLQNNATGMQVIDKLEAMLRTKVPSVIITGDTSPEILQEIHHSDRHLLHKPVAPEQLRSFIAKLIAQQKTAALSRYA